MLAMRLVYVATFHAAAAIELPWPGFLFYPSDPRVGTVEDVSDEVLSARIRGKSALVIGGTDGIGEGIALAMARRGASVTVVGHSPAKANDVLHNMSARAKYPHEQHFHAYASDLSTVQGCLSFTQMLKSNCSTFDFLVLTVGIWPDVKNRQTSDGIDKVIALDVLARFVITQELLPLLKHDARVMSVLGSTMRTPLPDVNTVQEIALSKKEDYSLPQILGTAGLLGDTWLQALATRVPTARNMSFIGTWPGVLADNLIEHSATFPPWLRPFLDLGVKAIGLKAEECGRLHSLILSSPNVAARSVTYFNIKLEGRRTAPLAYDEKFGEWAWTFLQQSISNHSRFSKAAMTANVLLV